VSTRKARRGIEVVCEYLFRPLAQVVVVMLAPLRVPPPAVVVAAATAGCAGAVELARGHLVVAALLVQSKTVLDNADGQLARLTNRVTLLGRYLDSECDLFVDAALFAALGWYTHRPVVCAIGFLALTGVLSLNFNVERIARGAPVAVDPYPVLGRAYALAYGWQDRLVQRALGAVPIGPRRVGALANLGLSTQLAAFGVCLAAGRPLLYVWLLLGQVVFVAALFAPLRPNQEVVLEHR
jgi:archaetidylinositol phosphate synthase